MIYPVILTDDNFTAEVLRSDMPVFVVFTAEWSGSSHIIAPIIENAAAKYKATIKVAKLDIDKNRKTAVKYGIGEIPVLLVFHNGEILDHIYGVFSSRELESKIQQLLYHRNKSRVENIDD